MNTLLHILAWLFSLSLIVGFVLYLLKPYVQIYQYRRDERLSKKKQDNDPSNTQNATFYTDADGSFHASFHCKKKS